MRNGRFYLSAAALWLLSCNTAPPGPDFTGLYYPITKKGAVDSSEVLHVSRLDQDAYVFKVSGNSGVGKRKGSVVSGLLKGPAIGAAPFTFAPTGKDVFEFRAMGSRVDLARLPAQP